MLSVGNGISTLLLLGDGIFEDLANNAFNNSLVGSLSFIVKNTDTITFLFLSIDVCELIV